MLESLTGKQKRFLRAMGSTMDPIVQVGKGGVSETLVESLEQAIKSRELIKIKVLQNCLEHPKAVIAELAEKSNSHLVQVIGRNGLLYKENPDEPKIELP